MEFCHNIKPIRQPTPHITPGGDCFICATTAMMRHLFPDEDIREAEINNAFQSKNSMGELTYDNTWVGYEGVFRRLCYGIRHDGNATPYPIEYRRFLPSPNAEALRYGSQAWGGIDPCEYFWMVDAFLRGGYVLLIETDADGRGPSISRDGGVQGVNSINHVALIDGARQYYPPLEDGTSCLQKELHIVDSNLRHATNEYWIPVEELLFRYGAAGFYMVRKSTVSHT